VTIDLKEDQTIDLFQWNLGERRKLLSKPQKCEVPKGYGLLDFRGLWIIIYDIGLSILLTFKLEESKGKEL
jgi:hypothetical protein